jgi:hypothetical protein
MKLKIGDVFIQYCFIIMKKTRREERDCKKRSAGGPKSDWSTGFFETFAVFDLY